MHAGAWASHQCGGGWCTLEMLTWAQMGIRHVDGCRHGGIWGWILAVPVAGSAGNSDVCAW